jgi:hypothetical protein
LIASKPTPSALGLVAVDVQLQLGRVFQAVGAHAGQQLALRGHAEQLVARRDQGRTAIAAAVLQPEVETCGIAQLRNGRWAQGEDEGVLHAHQRTERAPARSCADWPGARRSSQSFRVTKPRAAFCPWPRN